MAMNVNEAVRRLFKSELTLLFLGIGIVVMLRVRLLEFVSKDFTVHFAPWFDYILLNGRFEAWGDNFSNNNPPILYLYTLVSYLPIKKLFAVKLISVFFDFVAASAIYAMVHHRFRRTDIATMAFMLFLLSPTVFVNSAMWGQSDVIYSSLLLWCLYFAMTDRPHHAFIFFGLAFSFKLQAVFMFPFLGILFFKRHAGLQHFLWIPLVLLISWVPSLLMGREVGDLLGLYYNQADYHPGLTLSTANLYYWLPGRLKYDMFFQAGMILALAVAFFFVMVVARSRQKLTEALMVQLACLSVLLSVFFLPNMHERFYFAADAIAIALAFYRPKLFWVPVVLILLSFFSYTPFLLSLSLFDFKQMSLMMLFVILWLIQDAARQLFPKALRVPA